MRKLITAATLAAALIVPASSLAASTGTTAQDGSSAHCGVVRGSDIFDTISLTLALTHTSCSQFRADVAGDNTPYTATSFILTWVYGVPLGSSMTYSRSFIDKGYDSYSRYYWAHPVIVYNASYGGHTYKLRYELHALTHASGPTTLWDSYFGTDRRRVWRDGVENTGLRVG